MRAETILFEVQSLICGFHSRFNDFFFLHVLNLCFPPKALELQEPQDPTQPDHSQQNLNENAPLAVKKKDLRDEQRQAVFEFLLKQSQDGRRRHGSVEDAAEHFNISTRTVGRIWSKARQSMASGQLVTNVGSGKKGRVGRKKKDINIKCIAEIPLKRRSNIRSLASAMDVSKSTLHRRVKEGLIRPHTNAIKPGLKQVNKEQRLRFCLSMIDSNPSCIPTFKKMFDYVHIDEKWFYMTKTTERYYLLPQEMDPERSCQSKRFVTKVMFLAAVARSRLDYEGKFIFDGKIGIFPFVEIVPAKRSSKNRPAGTLEMKPINAVTQDMSRVFLIEKVLPTIRKKWPDGNRYPIILQQDNAKPHILPEDKEFLEAALKDGFDIRLTCQPPNSPDMNVLDLGFFRAIQSLQHQEAPTTVDELISAVVKAFNELHPQKLNNVFLTLQQCMIETMKVGGGNNYRIPHMGKSKLIKEGRIPITLECDLELIEKVKTLI